MGTHTGLGGSDAPRSAVLALLVVLLLAPVLGAGWLWLAPESPISWILWGGLGAVLRYWHRGNVRWTRLARVLFAVILLSATCSALVLAGDIFVVPFAALMFMAGWDRQEHANSEVVPAALLLAMLFSVVSLNIWLFELLFVVSWWYHFVLLIGAFGSDPEKRRGGLGRRVLIAFLLLCLCHFCMQLPWPERFFIYIPFNYYIILSLFLLVPLYCGILLGKSTPLNLGISFTSVPLLLFPLLPFPSEKSHSSRDWFDDRIWFDWITDTALLNGVAACLFALGLWLLPSVLGVGAWLRARRMLRTGACGRDFHRLTLVPGLPWLVRWTGGQLYEEVPRRHNDLSDDLVCRECGGRDIISARQLVGVIGAMPGTPDTDDERHVLLYEPATGRAISADIDRLDLYPPPPGTALDWDHAVNAVVNALSEDHRRSHPLKRIPVRLHGGLMLPANARRVLDAHFANVTMLG
jgi:hypothetical protein